MKMKHLKRSICLLLCLTMVLSLAACGGDKDKDNKGNSAEGYVYVPTYTKVQGDFPNGVGQSVYADGKFYTVVYEYDNYETYEGGRQTLYTIDLEGKSTKLSGFVSTMNEDEDSYNNISALCVDKDGKLCYLETYTKQFFNAPEGTAKEDRWDYYDHSESTYVIKWLKEDGSVEREMALDDMVPQDTYINGFQMDNDGNIYINADSKVIVIGSNGEKLFEYEDEDGNWIDSMMKLGDGSVVFSVYGGERGYNVMKLNLESKSAELYCTTDSYFYNTCPGDDNYALYYSNGSYLNGLKIEAGENDGERVGVEERVLTWINSDVDGDEMQNFFINPEGQIIALTEEYIENTSKKDTTTDTQTIVNADGSISVSSHVDRNGTYDVKILTLVKTPAKDVAQKTTLTLATQYMGWDTRKAVLKFNRANSDYRIEIVDYSEYNDYESEDGYDAGVKKLTTEIMSGDVPDIIYTEGLPVSKMAARGLLADLYTFMEGDEELSRDKFIPSVLNLMEEDGHLYQSPTRFSIMTVIGNKNVVGETPGWTVDDLKAALAAMPAGCTVFNVSTTRDNILQYMLYMDMNDYVDWAAGTCNFDSQQFVDLLEFVKMFPSEFDWENYDWSTEESEQARIASGKQLLQATGFSEFWDFQYNTVAFGDDAVMIGFPTTEGVGNAMMFNSGYAISEKCANKDVAWQFVRGFVTGEYGNNWGFSPVKEKFDAALKEAMTPRYETNEDGSFKLDENGNKIEISIGGWSDGINQYDMYAMTQKQADQLNELINNCTKVISQDDSLIDIIKEEGTAFFNDQKSAEETAKMIQSRVSVLVKEQA